MTADRNLPQPDWRSACGNYVLFCGDCLEIVPRLPDGCVDAVVTDPPYEITAGGGGIGATRRVYQHTEGFTDCGFDYQMLSGFNNWACFGTLRQLPKLIDAAGDRRWMLITWNKPNPCPLTNNNYLPDTEYIIHAWRNGGLHGGYREKSRYIVYPCGNPDDGTHPNEKPIAVMEKVIASSSGSAQTILDPFMGSGTTGVACVKLGRKFIGIELDRGYFDVAVKRIERAIIDHNGGPMFAGVKDDPKLFNKDRH